MEPLVFVIVLPIAALILAAIVFAFVVIAREPSLSREERLIWAVAFVVCMPLTAIVWGVLGPHPFGLRVGTVTPRA